MSAEGILLGLLAAIVALIFPRRGCRGWIVAVVLCLPVVIVLLNPAVRIISHHGFIHANMVYRILESGVPPEDPHFAGNALHYPWAAHAIVAGLCRALDVTPGTGFALLNVAALFATANLLYAVARRLTDRREGAALGVLVSLCGYSLFAGGPLADAFTSATGFAPDVGATPLQKFTNVNLNAFGFFGWALFLLALMELARSRTLRSVLLLFTATLVTALLYPLTWAAIGAAGAAAVVALVLFARPRLSLRQAGGAFAAMATGSLFALPYLLQIQAARSPDASQYLNFSLTHLAGNAAKLALALFGLALLAGFERAALVRMFQRARSPVLVLAACALTCALTYLLTGGPMGVEYKYLALSGLCCGLLAGAPLASLRSRSKLGFVVLLALLLTPMGSHLAEKSRRSGRVVVEGQDLRHPDASQHALHGWLRANTPADALFVDSELALPTYARRSLFVAMDPDRGRNFRSKLRGWRMPPSVILISGMGYTADTVARRRRVTRALLDPDAVSVPPWAVQAVRRAAGGRVAYVVAREQGTARHLAADARFELVKDFKGISLFRLRPPPT